jgi:polysaccharide deacetylase family protein (PEP-CTERM system associated)
MVRPTLLLSIDFEDWNQLVHRSLGLHDWDIAREPFRRQTREVLSMLDAVHARATFFVLGMTAKNYPSLVEEVAARGHEIACHGHWHRRAFTQSSDGFRRDVEACVELIERIVGRAPTGYRAPAFSINRDSMWAYDVLADLGFEYDSSQYDSPRVPRRIGSVPTTPYRLALASGRELWELPVAVWKLAGAAVPIGGGAYWRAFPRRLLLHALETTAREAGYPVLYFHPYECDPAPLRVSLPQAATRRQHVLATYKSLQRNPGRGRVAELLRVVADRFRLVSYEQARGEIEQRFGARTKALSPQGVLV